MNSMDFMMGFLVTEAIVLIGFLIYLKLNPEKIETVEESLNRRIRIFNKICENVGGSLDWALDYLQEHQECEDTLYDGCWHTELWRAKLIRDNYEWWVLQQR